MDYFLAKAGHKPVGPLSREQVRELLNERKFLITDLVWTAAQKDWLQISSRLEFYSRPTPVSTSTIAPRLGYEPATATRGGSRVSAAALYEAYIGPGKIAYYAPIFERLDLGKSPSAWNPAAGIVTPWWMIYRGMLLWGLLWYPALVLLMAMAVLMMVTQLAAPVVRPSAYLEALGLLSLGSVAMMGSYGNRLLHAHVRRKIEQSKQENRVPEERMAWLRRAGAPRIPLLGIVIAGSLAALGFLLVATGPAYRDFVVRTEVAQAVLELEPVKSLYLQRLTTTRKWPSTLEDIGVHAGSGSWGPTIDAVGIGPHHELHVTFGPRPISGTGLTLTPEVRDGTVSWNCALDQLPRKYAPSGCR